MQCPRAAVFDLDDTLAESFKAPSAEMIGRLKKLLARMPVGIATAASFERMKKQFLGQLEAAPGVERLFIFPNVASECYSWKEGWHAEYSHVFTPEEFASIDAAIKESIVEVNLVPDPRYEPLIVNRGGKVAFAALGYDATTEEKSAWDPDKTKRTALKEAVGRRLPNVEISIGGTTTIDISPEGIDKAYGVEWFAKKLGVPVPEMLYVGDALFPGGNDAIVIPTGIQTRAVAGPDETLKVIDELLAACAVK